MKYGKNSADKEYNTWHDKVVVAFAVVGVVFSLVFAGAMKTIATSAPQIVVITAPEVCEACRDMDSEIAILKQKAKNLKVIDLGKDKSPNNPIVRKYGITVLPTTLIVYNGHVIKKFQGYTKAEVILAAASYDVEGLEASAKLPVRMCPEYCYPDNRLVVPCYTPPKYHHYRVKKYNHKAGIYRPHHKHGIYRDHKHKKQAIHKHHKHKKPIYKNKHHKKHVVKHFKKQVKPDKVPLKVVTKVTHSITIVQWFSDKWTAFKAEVWYIFDTPERWLRNSRDWAYKKFYTIPSLEPDTTPKIEDIRYGPKET